MEYEDFTGKGASIWYKNIEWRNGNDLIGLNLSPGPRYCLLIWWEYGWLPGQCRIDFRNNLSSLTLIHWLQDNGERFNGTLWYWWTNPIIIHEELQKALAKAKINKAIRIDKIPNETTISKRVTSCCLYDAYVLVTNWPMSFI